MRNNIAEEKLMNICEKYRRNMWAQSPSQKRMVTPMKRTNTQLQARKEYIPGTSVQLLNRPRQIQNKISRCLNFDVEDVNIQIAEGQLQETNKVCMTDM